MRRASRPSRHCEAAGCPGGSSNREVAQALFVTVKTVETHLARAYRKPGIRGRAELAGAVRHGREGQEGTAACPDGSDGGDGGGGDGGAGGGGDGGDGGAGGGGDGGDGSPASQPR
ncbi:response regulator transcription factor [Streptomyces sediminimaris]|uniref:response regulator transcription factor n=1 Tax=Streptomyces sediminimaris TaxID=3383721 RepID=UPI00399B21C1